jgi:hypothetical protein
LRIRKIDLYANPTMMPSSHSSGKYGDPEIDIAARPSYGVRDPFFSIPLEF